MYILKYNKKILKVLPVKSKLKDSAALVTVYTVYV